MSDIGLTQGDRTAGHDRSQETSLGLSSGTWRDYLDLLKPRVMSLVIFTSIVGLVTAPGSLHPILAFTAVLCIAVGAGASGALNMWYDADIDAVMQRTRRRPIPLGRVSKDDALAFGLFLSAASVLLMGLAVNWVAAGLLAFTIAFYAVVYTMWLKRSTPQNIVIGGAAGAFPPMIGWAAVTGGVSLESAVLFLIIFMWTPPHFWALALYRSGDYEKAGVPMMPVVQGQSSTRLQILIYALLLFPVTLLPAAMGFAGWLYLATAGVTGAVFIVLCAQIRARGARAERTGDAKLAKHAEHTARRAFAYSITYLFLVFAALLIEGLAGLPPLPAVLSL